MAFRLLKQWLTRPTIADIALLPPASELRKRTKIVVIDDDPDSFPTKALRDEGYTLEWWSKVDGQALSRLERGDFDIVVLDIQGIAEPSLSDTGDGLGVLRRIKSVNQRQVVVAFSGQSYDLGSVPFWKMADDALRKPVTIIQCKELIDRLIAKHVSVRGYWDNVRALLEQSAVSPRRIQALERRIVQSAQGASAITLEQVRDIVGTIENLETVFVWVRRILSLCTLAF